jgi:hypothetical protein
VLSPVFSLLILILLLFTRGIFLPASSEEKPWRSLDEENGIKTTLQA